MTKDAPTRPRTDPPALFRKDEPTPAERREAWLFLLASQAEVLTAGIVGSRQWPTAADRERVAKEARLLAEPLFQEWLKGEI